MKKITFLLLALSFSGFVATAQTLKTQIENSNP